MGLVAAHLVAQPDVAEAQRDRRRNVEQLESESVPEKRTPGNSRLGKLVKRGKGLIKGVGKWVGRAFALPVSAAMTYIDANCALINAGYGGPGW